MFRSDFIWGIDSKSLTFPEDLALLRLLKLKEAKLTLSFSALYPAGMPEANPAVIEYYKKVLKAMTDNGIRPSLTLYDGDLPKALENCGGFKNPDSPSWFETYAAMAAEAFSPYCDCFVTMSDPPCGSFLEAHNLLIAHGKAVAAIREHAGRAVTIGFSKSAAEVFPFSSTEEDIDAARDACFAAREDAGGISVNYSWFLDPICFGSYPGEGMALYEEELPEICETDMELIRQPIDFLGLNLAKKADPVSGSVLYWVPKFVYEKYHLPLIISCGGVTGLDCVSQDGCVHDANRIALLETYLGALQKASDEGVSILGFYMDGFRAHRGLIFADDEAKVRIVKDSGYWYADAAGSGGATLTVNRKARQILFLEPDEEGNVDLTSWISEGLYAGYTLDELLHQMPELFGGVVQPKAEQELIALEIEDEAAFLQDQPYLYVTVAEGDGLLNGHLLKKGDHFILPCGFGEARFRGHLKLLVSARVAIELIGE